MEPSSATAPCRAGRRDNNRTTQLSRRHLLWISSWLAASIVVGLAAYYPAGFSFLLFQYLRGKMIQADNGLSTYILLLTTWVAPIGLAVVLEMILGQKVPMPRRGRILVMACVAFVAVVLLLRT